MIRAVSEVKSRLRITVSAHCGHTEGEGAGKIGFRRPHRAPREIIKTTARYTLHHILDYWRRGEGMKAGVCVCADKRAVEHLDAGDSSAHTRYEPN